MSTATKAAVAAGSVAGGALGGAALGGAFNSGSSKQPTTSVTTPKDNTPIKTLTPEANPPSSQPQPQEPDWKPLSLEISGSGNDYENKIGKEYKHLLVGPYGNSNNINQPWWEKQFTKYNTEKDSDSGNLSTEFSSGKITVGYKPSSDSTTQTSLNKVCDSIYKKAKTDIESKSANDAPSKLRDNLWKYCSPIETRPQTIKDVSSSDPKYGQNTFGKTKEDKLLSTKDKVNEILWSIKQKEFFDLSKVDDEFFNDLYKNRQTNKSLTALKDKCEEAYKKTKPGTGKADSPTEDAVVKYCSIELMSS